MQGPRTQGELGAKPLFRALCIFAMVALGALTACGPRKSGPAPAGARGATQLLHVSYDPTRELFDEINSAFRASWEDKTGQKVEIKMSHGGSAKQARAVIDGLEGDVVSLALAYDVDAISRAGLIQAGWQERLPQRSAPFSSIIVFLVRSPDPKNIRDWNDLIRPGVTVITPNPKTSGGARWNYLAAWAYAMRQAGSDEAKAREFLKKLYANVAVLDTGARGATTTFVERGIGDVLVTWESEARLALERSSKGRFALVVPSLSIHAEPPVALVDEVVRHKGTQALAQAYLEFLYSDRGQEIASRHHFRPRQSGAAFPQTELVTVESLCGGWQAAHDRHFSPGGIFDQIYEAGPRRP